MLADNQMIAFVATTSPERARAFYGDVLGLKLESDSQFALVYSGGGRMLRIQKVQQFTPQRFTALGWKVADIRAAVAALAKRGVKFERFPGMEQDDLGIWSPPDGGKVCWFKDPDGNALSLTQFAA